MPSIGPGASPTGTTLSINIAAPFQGGAVTSYVIEYRISGTTSWTTLGSVTWIGWQTLSGLRPATSYDVEVYATNSAGSGPPSGIYTAATAPN
jgi:hypothetical protein